MSDATRHENAETCVAYEYGTEDTDINIARVEVRGRYPIEGTACNTLVKELVYVESGNGTVTINEESFTFGPGDVISIDKEEKVYWEGSMVLVIACAPAWTPEQYLGVPQH